MRLGELGLLYMIVGLGCAVAIVLSRRARGGEVAFDALLLLPFWPLYGPFLFLRDGGQGGVAPADGAEEDPPPYATALVRAKGTPLAELLPDGKMAAALEGRLALAEERVDEIDRLLGQRDFDEARALERQGALERAGDERAAATARSRVASIRRLFALRERFSAELTEIGELLAQLRVQAELLRLSGDGGEETGDLVGELAARLESLDEILGAEEEEGLSAAR